jgi:hypothetical protein
MKKNLLTLAFVLVAALPLGAETSSQTNDYSGTPNFSGTLVFDKLNAAAAGWTVTQVVVTSTMNIDGFSLTVSNVGAVNATLDEYAFGAKNRVIITPISATNTLLATDTGKPGTVIASGATVTVNGTHQQASYTWTITDSSQVSQFLGPGTFTAEYDATQTKTVSTSGSTQDRLNPSTSWGSVIVNFFYAIPEPSTWAMIGGAALMLLVLKRKGEDA